MKFPQKENAWSEASPREMAARLAGAYLGRLQK